MKTFITTNSMRCLNHPHTADIDIQKKLTKVKSLMLK